jgi:hypothetical protein
MGFRDFSTCSRLRMEHQILGSQKKCTTNIVSNEDHMQVAIASFTDFCLIGFYTSAAVAELNLHRFPITSMCEGNGAQQTNLML